MYRRSYGRSSTKGPISWGRLWKAAPYCTRRAVTAHSNAGGKRGRENRGEHQDCSAIQGRKQGPTGDAEEIRNPPLILSEADSAKAEEAAVEGPRRCRQQEHSSQALQRKRLGPRCAPAASQLPKVAGSFDSTSFAAADDVSLRMSGGFLISSASPVGPCFLPWIALQS